VCVVVLTLEGDQTDSVAREVDATGVSDPAENGAVARVALNNCPLKLPGVVESTSQS
jgi:hypothetical protein